MKHGTMKTKFRQWCISWILFNLYSEYCTKEAFDGIRGFKIGGQVICTVKYAVDFVLLDKEETVLEGKPDRQNEVVGY